MSAQIAIAWPRLKIRLSEGWFHRQCVAEHCDRCRLNDSELPDGLVHSFPIPRTDEPRTDC